MNSFKRQIFINKKEFLEISVKRRNTFIKDQSFILITIGNTTIVLYHIFVGEAVNFGKRSLFVP